MEMWMEQITRSRHAGADADDLGGPWAESHLTLDNDGPISASIERIAAAGRLLESSRMMTELLRYAAPDTHRRTERITRFVTALVGRLELDSAWEFEVAARFSQIGRLALPEPTRQALARGEALSGRR
jgi:hypothetical protein